LVGFSESAILSSLPIVQYKKSEVETRKRENKQVLARLNKRTAKERERERERVEGF
jgi:hypothetical protein